MNHQHLVLHAQKAHPSLESWLCGRLSGIGRQQLESLFHQRRIFVNERPALPSQEVNRGDRIDIYRRYISEILPEALPVDIVYEDTAILVVNKPAGMPVHPGLGHFRGTLLNAIAHHYLQSGQAACLLKEAVVHRLDKDTSGLMVLAKCLASKTYLEQQFRKKTIQRHYLALVWGRLQPQSGSINLPMGRHPGQRNLITTDPSGTWGKWALTHYEVIEQREDSSLVRLRPITGRTHQLRVHLHAIGHGIAGDTRYVQAEGNASPRLMLHALMLAFTHPSSKLPVSFNAAVPVEFEALR
jgi:23S rRNA pseudouridine1911/1915/1917 synthase